MDLLRKLPSITISAVVNRHMSTCLLVKLAESMPGTARLRVLCSSGLSAKSEFHGWLQRESMSQNLSMTLRTWKSLQYLQRNHTSRRSESGVQLACTYGESKLCDIRGKLVSFRMDDKQVWAGNSRSLAHLAQYMWPEHEVKMAHVWI